MSPTPQTQALTQNLNALLKEVGSVELKSLNPDDIRDLRNLRAQYESSVKSLQKQYEETDKAISEITTFDRINSFIEESQEKFHEVLLKKIDEAFQVNPDFRDLTEWKNHLKNLVRERGFVVVFPREFYGKTTSVHFDIDIKDRMMLFLGGPIEYGEAVKATRGALSYGDKATGIRASVAWFKKLWIPGRIGVEKLIKAKGRAERSKQHRAEVEALDRASGKKVKRKPLKNLEISFSGDEKALVSGAQFYWKIMNLRLMKMADMAPYWYLLNYGAVSLPSDKGGRAMPHLIPTNFVGKAENEIETWCNANFKTFVSKYEQELIADLHSLPPTIKKHIEIVRILDTLINSMTVYSGGFDVALERLKLNLIDVLFEAKRYPEIQKTLDQKLELIARQIILGVAPARVELIPSKNRQFRIRLTQIQEEIRREIANRGISKPIPETMAKLLQRISIIEQELVINALKNRQVKQLKALGYQNSEIEKMFLNPLTKAEIEKIIAQKIPAASVIINRQISKLKSLGYQTADITKMYNSGLSKMQIDNLIAQKIKPGSPIFMAKKGR